MRILITVSPLMYREAIALSLYQHRPSFDVRLAPPESAWEQVSRFGPHLIVHNDTDVLDPEVLGDVPFRVEVRYSNGIDAKISINERVEKVQDISIERLLMVADEAAAQANGGQIPARCPLSQGEG